MTPASGKFRSRIKTFLRRNRGLQTQFLAELVKTPSDNPPGDCRQHGMRARRLLQALDFKVRAHPVPAETVRAAGMQSAVNLVVRENFGPLRGGPVIALNAHGDVVPPGLGWSVDPYGARIRKGYMLGRGVAVSKSDFATYAFALLALKAAAAAQRHELRGSVELHFTYDEEAGGEIGPKRLLDEGISRPDFVICAGFTHGITIAHNGCLHLEVEVIGKSGHAARPATGIDALEAGNGIMTGLYALRKTWRRRRSATRGIDSPTLVIGLVSGGINTNVVPDNVKFRIDRRIIPEENPQAAERDLIAQIRRLAAHWPGVRVTSRRVLLARPFTPVRGQEKLVAVLRRNGNEVLGERLQTHGVPLYSDARHYSAAGIPTVLYGAGPRTLEQANGHRADEKLKLADLYAATEVVALSLADLLGGQA
ncbi:MAG: peptidase M20 [Betaproteobacteria bacterium RIFCSPLOWO2_02_FULL_62_17]|nr:MAG: peptidase M20 [Betaproteobacteria bacterium RIFCSPLOWO2_02_FULL_62_17]